MTVHGAQLRVLHVVSSTDRRGAESAAVELNRRLAGLGCGGEVVALAPGQTGGLAIPTLGPSRLDGRTVWSLRSVARGYDMVVAHGSSTLPAVSATTVSGSGTPFVYRSIGDPRAWMTTRSRRLRVRLEVGRAAGIVALWSESALFWHERLGVRAERIEVIPNWVDDGRFPLATATDRDAARSELGLPGEGTVVLCLGSLSAEKRVDLAIRAVAGMPGTPILLVVGDGPQRSNLELLGAQLLGDRAVFVGRCDDPYLALAACDVVVIPSETEGQPAVAIEAGLSGRPVVATRVGGVSEIVRDGLTGVLVAPLDHQALAAGLTGVLQSRSFSAAGAREHCLRGFSLAGIARRWMCLLQRLVT